MVSTDATGASYGAGGGASGGGASAGTGGGPSSDSAKPLVNAMNRADDGSYRVRTKKTAKPIVNRFTKVFRIRITQSRYSDIVERYFKIRINNLKTPN